MVGVRIEQLAIGADASRWADAGFAVERGGTRVGEVVLGFTEGEGIRAWRLRGLEGEIDGLPAGTGADLAPTQVEHPNGVTRIDHVVVLTPDLERTTEAFEATGVDRRRVREVRTDDGELRQGFFRLGEVILELVEHPKIEPGPARFWGLTFAVADLEAAARLLGERLGAIRDAVQPGRRIATVRQEAGLGLPVALISA
jgi:glyoxalase/bleomycin resistance protein/dioxygenase superfamily protein